MLKRLLINNHYKFQFEKIKKTHVLLYPEGVITLNDTASEVLKLCDGKNDIDRIKTKLLNKYDTIDGIDEFITDAIEKKWIVTVE